MLYIKIKPLDFKLLKALKPLKTDTAAVYSIRVNGIQLIFN
jgi:plasmid maintenance system killer protein